MNFSESTETDPSQILLVDDDRIILDSLSKGLVKAGYWVRACDNGQRALQSFSESTPDLAVVDIGLPDMSGTDLARRLLEMEYRPILVLSGHDDAEIVKRAIASGVEGYLVKPLSVPQLIPSIETSMARFRARNRRVATHLDSQVPSAHHLGEVINGFSFAVAIVNEKHHPLFKNTQLKGLMARHLFYTDVAGRLRSVEHAEKFVTLLKKAFLEREHTSVARIPTATGGGFHAWARRLTTSQEEAPEPIAVVVIFGPEVTVTLSDGVLKALYGLTPKESKLAQNLVRGRSIMEHCRQQFVTLNTAKTQLKAIFQKTGTHRQQELISLLASMFVPR